MKHRQYEHLGLWHLGMLLVLLTIGTLLSSISESYGQDYWSSVFPAKPQWGQPTPPADPYRPNGNAGYLGTEVQRGTYNPDRRISERNPTSLLIQPGTPRSATGPQTIPGFFGGLSHGLLPGNPSNLEFSRLGSWHQLVDLQLQFTRTDRVLFDVLAREADRELASDDRATKLLEEWDKDGAQSRIDWERQCPVEAAWVRDHVQWYGQDSIEALTTKLQAVTDCPPGSS
jgi:hypothetical protein